MHAILEIRNLTPQERAVMDALLISPDITRDIVA